jgi:hypothetical protein
VIIRVGFVSHDLQRATSLGGRCTIDLVGKLLLFGVVFVSKPDMDNFQLAQKLSDELQTDTLAEVRGRADLAKSLAYLDCSLIRTAARRPLAGMEIETCVPDCTTQISSQL